MNNDRDMAHTVSPLSTDARAAFLRGHILADRTPANIEAFLTAHPDLRERAVESTTWAGPGASLWYTLEERTAFERRVAVDA